MSSRTGLPQITIRLVLLLLLVGGCAPGAAAPLAEQTAAPTSIAAAPAAKPTTRPAEPTAAPQAAPPATPTPLPLSDGSALESSSADEVLARPEDPAPAETPVEAPASAPPAPAAEDPCQRPPGPLPAPGSAGSGDFWSQFRTPLPPAPVWNPPGPKRVGLQAGHWRVEEVPPELGRLGHGATGGGKAEWEVNLDVARRTAEILEAAGVEVDILPATVPPRYRAHAFLSIHADGDESGRLRGYKLARAIFSATPDADDRLLASLYDEYGAATGLPRDDLHISRRMTGYYAFNSRRYCHAVAPGVPAAILEMGFLTSAVDRQVLLGRPDAIARGVARGLLRFLGLPT